MLTFPIPDALAGDRLAEEITAAGYTQVAVSVAGGQLCVRAAELADPMPPAEDRNACETQAELDAVMAAAAAAAEKANADDAAAIAAIVAAHVPPPASATTEERVAALPDPTTDLAGFRAGLVDLLNGGR